MDVENLRHFVHLVDAGSIQGAARQLGVSRSVLRRAVDELEAEVGTALLHRDPSGVRLTAAGAVALERARPIIESARSFLAETRAAELEPRGVIRVVEPVGLPTELHVRMALMAHALLPNQLIVVRHLENPVTALDEPFELMLHEGPPPDRSTWFSRVVTRVRLRAAASPDYLAERGTPRTLEELAAHDVLGWSRPGQTAGEWPLCGGGSWRVHPWFTSSDPQLLATLAVRGGGILLSANMPFSDEGALVPVLEDQVGGEIVFRATTPFPTRADPRTRDTVALLVAHLESLPRD